MDSADGTNVGKEDEPALSRRRAIEQLVIVCDAVCIKEDERALLPLEFCFLLRSRRVLLPVQLRDY